MNGTTALQALSVYSSLVQHEIDHLNGILMMDKAQEIELRSMANDP